MQRRTKIIATLGPAVQTADKIKALIEAGVDCFRINFSHAEGQDLKTLVANTRASAKALNKEVAIIADLQGPKIRIGGFSKAPISLKVGDTFTLDTQLDEKNGDATRVGLTYKALPNDVAIGDILLLGDGLISLEVTAVDTQSIQTVVLISGDLKSHLGINRQGGGLSAPALTEKDKNDIQTAVSIDLDYIAVSFVQDAADMGEARRLLRSVGGDNVGIIAKIERAGAIENLDEIIKESDAVMVARGDLAIEIGAAEVPAAQKYIINRARALNRATITATQIMESMINNPRPTRAEVSDCANAVLDGSDCLMLSAETAVGQYPIAVIEMVDKVCRAQEKHPVMQVSQHRVDSCFLRTDEAIAMAAMYTANHYPVTAIVALTESGTTVLWMSRINSAIPIYGLSRHVRSQRRMSLYRGVYPIAFDPTQVERKLVNQAALSCLEQMGILQKNDSVLITKGNDMGSIGGTNALKIVHVGHLDADTR